MGSSVLKGPNTCDICETVAQTSPVSFSGKCPGLSLRRKSNPESWISYQPFLRTASFPSVWRSDMAMGMRSKKKKNTALCVKGMAALKLWFFWAVNGFDDSSCGVRLTLCVVILGCYLVFIPNPNQARESPTLPETSSPLRLELTKMSASRCYRQEVRENAQPEMCLPQSMGAWVPGPAATWKSDLGDMSVILVLGTQK